MGAFWRWFLDFFYPFGGGEVDGDAASAPG
jgi:hypothetical protein